MQPVAIPVAVPAAPQPVVSELVPAPEPEEVFARLWGRPHCLFLDSAMRHPELGRYSYLAADPFAFLQVPANCGDALVQLSQIIQGMFASTAPELPPFQGGVAGLFGYELARGLEDVPRAAIDEFQVPALAVGLYDVVVAFDHHQGRAWIVSQGLPETGLDARTARAKARLSEAISWLSPAAEPRGGIQPGERQADIQHALIKQEDLATCFRVPGPEGLVSNFSSRGYCQAVQRAIDYIYEGDVFQVNLSQRLLFPAREDSVSLYQRLRRQNAATFSSYFDLGDFQICSTSPERFVQVRGRKVEARPIKGTCPRTARPEADLFAANGLQQSEKDRAENIMIVDLLRNDLSRACDPDTVCVRQLCALETYAFVQHLVSVVHGRLRDDCSSLDLLRFAFPGGSITGAPKIRAMEIIAELEPTARGAYCGSMGYLGFDGALDTSILIRTVTAGRGWWQIPVGGGIVAQSVPRWEYEETWQKAEGMLRALTP